MTLDRLVIEYKEKYGIGINYNSISKKIHDLFVTINVEPKLFKEGKEINSVWNFPDSCKDDFLTLIKYIDMYDESINRIRKGNVEVTDLNILKFFMETVIKALRSLKYPDEEINKAKNKMLKFTKYPFLTVKKAIQELLEDIDYMYNNDDDTLTFSDHMVFQNYAELEIKKLQEHLRFTYYTMNSDKKILEMQKVSKRMEKINKDGMLSDYLEKSMKVNNRIFKELGGFNGPESQGKETIESRREEIEIELFGEILPKHPYVKHITESFNLRRALAEDEEYQNIEQYENDILNKKILIKNKKNYVIECKKRKLKRAEELAEKMFEDRTIYTIEDIDEEESEDSFQLLENGISTAKMFIVAKQKRDENDWPIMISMCDEFFERKNK